MDAARFARLKREFQHLLGAGPAERRAALERLARDEADLAA